MNSNVRGRLQNWKFGQALVACDGTEEKEYRHKIDLLARLFGDVGWFDGDLGELVDWTVMQMLNGGYLPSPEVPEIPMKIDEPTVWIAKALSVAGFVKSTGEGKRLVAKGGVEVDRVCVTDENHQLERGKRYFVGVGTGVGSKSFAHLVIEGLTF